MCVAISSLLLFQDFHVLNSLLKRKYYCIFVFWFKFVKEPSSSIFSSNLRETSIYLFFSSNLCIELCTWIATLCISGCSLVWLRRPKILMQCTLLVSAFCKWCFRKRSSDIIFISGSNNQLSSRYFIWSLSCCFCGEIVATFNTPHVYYFCTHKDFKSKLL